MNERWTQPGRWAWVGIIAMTLAGAGRAEVPSTQVASEPSTQPTPRVLAMVNDLTSDQFSVRERAQRDLIQQGQSVIPQLQAILDAGQISDEARTRIGAAMHRIADEREFGASAITLHCKDAPLEGVLQDFAQQAGADMGINRPELRGYLQSRKITLNLQHADFWTALQAIEDGSGLRPRPTNDGRLILDNMMGFWMGQMGDRSRARVAGPCLIAPQSITWSMQYGTNVSILSLQIVTMVEPKLHLVGSFQGNWLRECVDDKGNSLLSPQNPGGFFGGQRQWLMTLVTNLRVVPGMGSKIARLKGDLVFEVQTKSETIEVNNILSAQNVVKNVAGSTITIQSFTNNGGQYQLHVLVSGALAAANSAFIQNAMTSQFQILDDNDQPLQQMGASQSGNGAGQSTLTIFFNSMNQNWNGPMRNPQAVGPPKKLRCEITTETRQMTEPFELDDLPLLHAPDDKNP